MPSFCQSPFTVRVFDPEMVRVAPLLIVRPAQMAAELIVGWFPPDGIITFVTEVGIPLHQFPAVFQSVLTLPVQVLFPPIHPVDVLTLIIPVAVDPK